MAMVIGGILQNLFFQFISDIIIDAVNSFQTFLNDLFAGSVDMLSSVSAINATCRITTSIGSALVVFLVLYKLFDVYIFENSGDPDADPLDIVVKGSFAMAIIQSNETIFKLLKDLSKEFADDLSRGAHLNDDFQTGINALLRNTTGVASTANVILAIILLVSVIAVLIKMTIRGAELIMRNGHHFLLRISFYFLDIQYSYFALICSLTLLHLYNFQKIWIFTKVQ